MTKEEALKMALEALEEAWYHVGTFQPTEKAIDLYDEARTAIKEALAQPEQEPVKDWIASHNEICALLRQAHDALALTSYPPQRTWVGLTDEDIDQGLLRSNHALQTAGAWRDGVEWATKQLKEKNT